MDRRSTTRPTKANDPLARVAWSTSSLSRVLFRTEIALDAAAVIPLGRPLPDASSSLPADSSESPSTTDPPLLRRVRRTSAYVALLPMGSALPPPLPEARWALTPPFHPGLPLVFPREAGGLFSVALSFAFPRPGVTRHRALRSSDFPPAALRRSERPCGLSKRLVHDRRSPVRHRRRQAATGSLAPQWGGCVSWGG